MVIAQIDHCNTVIQCLESPETTALKLIESAGYYKVLGTISVLHHMSCHASGQNRVKTNCQ